VKFISYLEGDATQPIGDGKKIIAHCCNDIGVWGAGFVLALSRQWPVTEISFRTWFRDGAPGGRLPLGDVQFIPVGREITIANIVGQRGCGFNGSLPPIRYTALQTGFREVARIADRIGASVHMPRIGCGLAGGDWARVEYLIDIEICRKDVPVFVYDFAERSALAIR
jgi:O-acetyl-ADP-ribose deacetylase (regulator of RNase III)